MWPLTLKGHLNVKSIKGEEKSLRTVECNCSIWESRRGRRGNRKDETGLFFDHKLFFFFNIYLAVPDLACGVQDLRSSQQHVGSLVAA